MNRYRGPGSEFEDDYDPDDPDGERDDFAEPGGRSALRAASRDDPRDLPCPTCERPNRLTRRDRSLGYQCNSCADRAEGRPVIGEDY